MKRKIALGVVAALVVLLLSSCALFAGETYTFTFVLGDGRDDVVAGVSEISDLYKPAPASDGVVFAGWYNDREFTEPYLLLHHTGDTTLFALWVEEGDSVMTIIWGDERENTLVTYEGDPILPANPSRKGYEFLYWLDKSTGCAFDPSAEHGNVIVIQAVWKSISETAVITLSVGGGAKDVSVMVNTGLPLEPPTPPERYGYTFLGWYIDPSIIVPFDFDKPVVSDLTLYARWEPDDSVAINCLAKEALGASVKLTVERREYQAASIVTRTTTGSGTVFAKLGNTYYCITNDHVAGYNGAVQVAHTVTDAYGTSCYGRLVYSDPAYDLAIVSFESRNTLSVVGLAASGLGVGDRSYSIGNPDGLVNVVTMGVVYRIEELEISGSEVTFGVVWHTTPISKGSSGGGVFNGEGRMVGVNYAASDNNGQFEMAFYIPLERVIEFILSAERSTGIFLITRNVG